MSKLVYVLNGPNLNMLGRREPDIYGHTTLAEIESQVTSMAEELGLRCNFRQTNSESVMVEWLQEAFEANAGVVLNPAGLSFFSVPVLDACKLLDQPLIEVHISNIHKRDEYHRHSMISTTATGVIAGLGAQGYTLALRAIAQQLRD
ncbi:type II 3-dehydroquinate dehydratase [Bordetella sp. N]|uniref:type II 3-dehydroquinate dehydratase n=1 Tax=Bordetella sp. N TaxID=1746199 RepID=UPI000708AB6B|nr:type II 3-dehydroquinate dehydratase [Bordetella sp. N]ALM84152.1 3-dehydroquinate dehydratase [Bordetella sp. N]